jgi:hypothetical protein
MRTWTRCGRRPSIFLAVTGAMLGVGLSVGISGQSAATRTPEGRPDLQGLWLNNTATPLERPKELGDRPTFTAAEAAAYEQRYQLDRTVAISRDKDFELDAAGDLDTYEPGRILPGGRNSLIVDPATGALPALTPEAQRQFAERTQHLNAHYAENPEDLPNAERCLTVGNTAVPPLMPAFYNNTLQIVQTRDHVVLVSEMIHDTRIVPLNRTTHLPSAVQLWKGDSIGRWEGDTLVVDTTNFTAKTSFRGSSAALHLIERFSLGAGGTLIYRVTVDDPAFVRSWTAESAMTRTDQAMFEYACHEGNYSLPNVLRGRRFGERRQSPRSPE